MGPVPDHHNKLESRNKVSHNLFVGGGPLLHFLKHTVLLQHNKAKHKETRYACSNRLIYYLLVG